MTITYTKKQKILLFNLYNNKTIIYVTPKKLKITHDADEHTDAVKSIKTEFFMPSGNNLQNSTIYFISKSKIPLHASHN